MKQSRLLQSVAAGVACLLATAVLAQDAGGLRLSLGVDQRFETGRNLSLDIPADGRNTLSATTLSFGLLTETRTQRLKLDLSSKLRLGSLPKGSRRGLDDKQARLSYRRESAASLLDLGATYRESQVDFLRSLTDFLNDEGEIELPEDFEDLRGRGDRRDYSATLKLELGRDGPLGFTLDARRSGIDYDRAAANSLFDIRRSSVGGTLRLRFSPVTSGQLNLNEARYAARDPAATRRLTRSVSFGLTHDVSSRTRVESSIGYSRTDTVENAVPTRESGAIARIGLRHDLPNGRLTADYALTRTFEGARQDLTFGRTLDLPRGSLGFTLGATRGPTGKNDLIGSLDWRHDLPDGRITARIGRTVATSNTDENRLTTTVAIGYSKDINPLSGLSLDLRHARTASTSTRGAVERTDLSASYSRALTEDWGLNAGINYRIRDEEAVGRTTAPSVFLAIDRRFEFRP